MTDADTISAAGYLEALKWAREGYRLTRSDGPVRMSAAELVAFARTGNPPARR